MIMNIKRIIREELESEDPWGWTKGFRWDEGNLRELLKQEGEIYLMPFRETNKKYDEEGSVYLYSRRGKPVVYYLTDKVPEVLTPDNGINSEPGSTWTWGENDVTIGDTFNREHDDDRPLPSNIVWVLDSLNHERGSDKYLVIDNNGEPMWDLTPKKYLEDLRVEFGKLR